MTPNSGPHPEFEGVKGTQDPELCGSPPSIHPREPRHTSPPHPGILRCHFEWTAHSWRWGVWGGVGVSHYGEEKGEPVVEEE